MTEVVPLSLPMTRDTCTSFLAPVKLAPVATARNADRSVPVGVISAFQAHAMDDPTKVKDPSSCFVKEPGGMVVLKVPACNVTASTWGWIPLLAGRAR